MRILVDMNLSPGWCPLLNAQGWECVHWSTVGDYRASDREIMAWAKAHGYVVLTQDLDFSAILAATGANGPSVFQVRAQDALPDRLGEQVVTVLRRYSNALEQGALLSFDEAKSRVRWLPISG